MSDLYTRLMEWVMPFLLANWQFFLIVVGALFLLGAIFRWKWVCDPQGENAWGFRAFVYRYFGEMFHGSIHEETWRDITGEWDFIVFSENLKSLVLGQAINRDEISQYISEFYQEDCGEAGNLSGKK